MRLLITGALGHIGSKLIHGLGPGHLGPLDEVVLLDDLSTQRYCTLFGMPDGVPFRFVEADVRAADLDNLFEGVDVVIHLAAITNAAGSFDIQEQVEAVNFEGTRRVAEACMRRGARLVFLSTTSVYGTQADVVDEDCTPEELKPQSPYADSKLRGERMLAALAAQGLRHVALRFGTIFGVSIGMRFHTAINKFVLQACLGQPLTVWRTALDQKRPYLDLADAERALRFVIEKDVFDGRIYNVLTTNSTVGEIVGVIRREIPDVRVELVDTRIMNQLSYEVSCARFRGLGFELEGDLARAIGETVALLRNVRARA